MNIAVSGAGIIFASFLIIYLSHIPSVLASDITTTTQTNKNTISPVQIHAGVPVRLKIPKIRVDAALESVGLTPQGAVDVPKGPVNAAWYKSSPRPGEKGSSVITGHFGIWKGGIPTVFNRLSELKKGDKIFVKDDNGITMTFIVRESRSFKPNADAAVVFGLADGMSHLNLITCEGIWNKISKSYPKRLVVFADRES